MSCRIFGIAANKIEFVALQLGRCIVKDACQYHINCAKSQKPKAKIFLRYEELEFRKVLVNAQNRRRVHKECVSIFFCGHFSYYKTRYLDCQ